MKTKICSHCKMEKEIEEFSWANKAKRLYQHRCKTCQALFVHNHYKTHRDRYDEVRDKNRERYRKEYDAYRITLKCSNCGDPRWYILDHHHVNPDDKYLGINSMRGFYPLTTIMKEIEKCIVLCANCHREVEYLARIRD